jgi:glycosyltransferase involved in cell wall biosynthesis
MGKKNRKKVGNKVSAGGKPFISICTPTYNRRKFIPFLIKCYKAQTYPDELMEWIIVDDGTDPVGDLFEGVKGVKYHYQEEKMKLGKKRNYMHSLAKGEIIVYMDDDDYYPPDRVNHVVNRLRSQPRAMACGSSAIYIYFQKQKEIYLFGPYGPAHATAGTFGFWRRLLKETSYEDDAEMAEEKHFLKNYTIPFVQLNPMKSILVFAHDANTFDKNRLLVDPNPKYVKKTRLKPKNFIKDKEMVKFYTEQ